MVTGERRGDCEDDAGARTWIPVVSTQTKACPASATITVSTSYQLFIPFFYTFSIVQRIMAPQPHPLPRPVGFRRRAPRCRHPLPLVCISARVPGQVGSTDWAVRCFGRYSCVAQHFESALD